MNIESDAPCDEQSTKNRNGILCERHGEVWQVPQNQRPAHIIASKCPSQCTDASNGRAEILE